MNDEQLLRDRLRAEVGSVDLPPGLAGRVETRARRRRRTRLAVAAAGLATVAAVAVAVPFLPRPSGQQPAAGASCDDDPVSVLFVGPTLHDASAAAWGFRGDPALKPVVEAIADRGLQEPAPLVLLAQPLGTGPEGAVEFAYAFARRIRGSWWAEVGTSSYREQAGGATAYSIRPEPLRPLPDPAVGAHVTAVTYGVDSAVRDTLVVLARTGTIEFRPCGGAPAAEVRHRGDGLLVARLRDPAGRELDGVLSIDAGGHTVFRGGLSDASPAVRPTGDLTRLPAGLRPGGYDRTRLTGARMHYERDFAASKDLPARGPVAILAACAGEGGIAVRAVATTVKTTCDGKAREVYRGTFDKRTDTVAVTSLDGSANLWVDFVVAPL